MAGELRGGGRAVGKLGRAVSMSLSRCEKVVVLLVVMEGK